MTNEDISKDLLLQNLQTQQKMSEDIADIRATIKEASQIMIHLNRDVSDVRNRVEHLERHPNECPAAKRHSAWALSAKDVMWLLALAGAAWALWPMLQAKT